MNSPAFCLTARALLTSLENAGKDMTLVDVAQL